MSALHLAAGSAPDTLTGLEAPDVVFIGGGLTAEGTVDSCWSPCANAWAAN